MNTEHTPVSYGEPWSWNPAFDAIENSKHEVIIWDDTPESTTPLNRAIECVNALAGIADPAESLDFVRNALNAAFEFADEVDDKYHRNMFTEALAKLSPVKV